MNKEADISLIMNNYKIDLLRNQMHDITSIQSRLKILLSENIIVKELVKFLNIFFNFLILFLLYIDPIK